MGSEELEKERRAFDHLKPQRRGLEASHRHLGKEKLRGRSRTYRPICHPRTTSQPTYNAWVLYSTHVCTSIYDDGHGEERPIHSKLWYNCIIKGDGRCIDLGGE